MTSKNRLSWIVFLVVAMTATSAFADPIRVTSGDLTVTLRPGTSGGFALSGEGGLSLTGHVSVFTGIFMPFQQCYVPECSPGTDVSLRAFWSGGDVSGAISFDGRTFPLNEFDGASVGLEFSGSFVAPPWSPSTAVLTAPFQLVPVAPGTLGSSFSFPYPEPDFQVLAGSGIATITLSPSGTAFPNRWSVDSVRYEFAAADPVPEPATLLLVGVGIAGVSRKVRNRRLGWLNAPPAQP